MRFLSPEPWFFNLSSVMTCYNIKGKGPRGHTLCVCVCGGDTLKKLEVLILVAHKLGGAFTVFSPPPVISRACKTRCIKTFLNESHGGLSAQRVNCSLLTANVFRFAVRNCLNTVFLVNEVKKKMLRLVPIFLLMNCSALSLTTVWSELFVYKLGLKPFYSL